MFKQGLQQIFFRMIDRFASDTDGSTDGLKVTSDGLGSFVRSELLNIDVLESKYNFVGDKYIVCPRRVSEKISREFFKNFPEMDVRFTKILGKFNLDIAYQYITVYSGTEHRQSLLWHHDSVGHRLKVFIPLYSTSQNNSLFWEKNTFQEYKRPVYREERKTYKPFGEILGHGSNQNEILILNTNSMHAGNPKISNGEIRNVFVLEFSNRLKSYVFGSRVGVREEV